MSCVLSFLLVRVSSWSLVVLSPQMFLVCFDTCCLFLLLVQWGKMQANEKRRALGNEDVQKPSDRGPEHCNEHRF